MMDGLTFGNEIVDIVKGYVERAMAPLVERLALLEGRAPLKGEPGEPGKDGTDADTETVARAAAALVAEHLPAELDAALDRHPAEKGDPGEPGAPGSDGVSPDPDELAATVTDRVARQLPSLIGAAVATLPLPAPAKDGEPGKDGVSPDPEELVTAAVAQVAAQLPTLIDAAVCAQLPMPLQGEPGRDGIDADPEQVATAAAGLLAERLPALVEAAVAQLPPAEKGEAGEPGKDGEDADAEGIANLAIAYAAEQIPLLVTEAVAALPAPEPGKDGDPGRDGEPGRDGIDADPEAITILAVADVVSKLPAFIEAAVAQLPPSEKGDPGLPGEPGKDGDPGKDGVDADPAEVARAAAALIAEELPAVIDRAVAQLPPPEKGEPGEPGAPGKPGDPGLPGKDGIGLSGALIGRDGDLVVTLGDGKTAPLGRVVGKDGENGAPGLGFDDLAVDYDGERRVTIRFARGEQIKEFSFDMPVLIDRGVWRAGTAYKRGDVVTWAGSIWIAQRDTEAKPDGGDDWRLSVKRGRDGKDTVRPA